MFSFCSLGKKKIKREKKKRKDIWSFEERNPAHGFSALNSLERKRAIEWTEWEKMDKEGHRQPWSHPGGGKAGAPGIPGPPSPHQAFGDPSAARPPCPPDWRTLGYRFFKQCWRGECETEPEMPGLPSWCSLPRALWSEEEKLRTKKSFWAWAERGRTDKPEKYSL